MRFGEERDGICHFLFVDHVLRAEAVAHHDPIQGRQPGLGAQLSRAPHHFGIDRWAFHRDPIALNFCQKIKVDEAVIKRCDKGIGHSMGHLRQARVAAGTINHDEIRLLAPAVLQRPTGGGPSGFHPG